MDWAVSVAPRCRDAVVIGKDGQRSLVEVSELSKVGLPSISSAHRVAFEGDFASWRIVEPDAYLEAFGMDLVDGMRNQHTVWTCQAGTVTAHIPTLVLMRAFFKPLPTVLPAVFRPASIDTLSFVNYAATPPHVVIDDPRLATRIAIIQEGVSQGTALTWLQLSESAKQSAHSVYRFALERELSLSLPSGRVKMILHGRLVGQELYVTKAALVSIVVAAADNLTGSQKEFTFHAMADATRTPTASIRGIRVSSHADGSVTVSDSEWAVLKHLLASQRRLDVCEMSQRHLLNIVLNKLATGTSWHKVPKEPFSTTDLTSAFRRWKTSGRLDKVLTQLETTRSGARGDAA